MRQAGRLEVFERFRAKVAQISVCKPFSGTNTFYETKNLAGKMPALRVPDEAKVTQGDIVTQASKSAKGLALCQELFLQAGDLQAEMPVVQNFAPHNFGTGLYFYKLTTGKFSQTRKAVLMK